MLASTTQLTYCQITASWVSMAPLGIASVPLVYTICARSVPERSTDGGGPDPAANSSKRTMPVAGTLASSEGSQTKSRTAVSSAAAARASSASPESVASICAWAWRRM